MAFQKFVAWENLPSLVVRPDAVGSSSSSSKSESGSNHELETDDIKLKATTMKPEIAPSPIIEIPPSVKNVLDKLDTTQLERAKKDVSKKLNRILDNVNWTYERYRKDEGIDPEIEKEYQQSQSWEERSRRTRLLDVIADVLDDGRFKIQELQMVLESFKNFNESLKTIDWRERGDPTDDMIEAMEEHILIFIKSIDTNVQRLIKIFHPLFEEKLKPRRKSTIRPSLFKAWREKVAEIPQEGEALTVERMMEDEPLTLARCTEISVMMQEMADAPFFNRVECVAVKYIGGMVANLTKAFSLLSKQCRGLKVKYDSLAALDSRKQDPQLVHLQRDLRAALEKKAALEMQVHTVEERCKILLITNETMQKELQDANERAMLVSKVSFPKAFSGKAPEKITSDNEKEMKSKAGDRTPVKPQAQPIQTSDVKSEEREISTEKGPDEEGPDEQDDQGKLQAPSPEKRDYLPLPSIRTQDGGIKPDIKDQKKDTFPEVGPVDISVDKYQPEVAQQSQEEKRPLEEEVLKSPEEVRKSPEEKAPLEEGALMSPEEKALLEKEALGSPEGKGPLEEVSLRSPEGASPEKKSPEEEGLPEEEAALISTTTEDRQAPEKTEGKGQAPLSKWKATKAVRRSSKLGQWKKLQTSLLKKSTKPQDELSSLEPPEESSGPSDEALVIQPAPVHDTTVSQGPTLEDAIVAQPTTSDDTSVTQPGALEDTSVTQPGALDDIAVAEPGALEDTSVTQPGGLEESSMIQPGALEDTSVTQPVTLEDTSVIQPGTLEDTSVIQPGTLDDIAVAEPTTSDDAVETKPASVQDARKRSPRPSVESLRQPGIGEDSVSISSEVEPPPLASQPAETPPGPSAPSEGTRTKHRVSLKGTAGKFVQTMKVKRLVKFMGDSMASESLEKLGAEPPESPLPSGAEGAEDSGTDAQEAGPQKRLTGKSKETREKKDTKRAGKMFSAVLQAKQAEKTDTVLRSLGAKLQEAARDRGGVLEAEAIKEIFEELGITLQDGAPGQGPGSQPTDKLTKGYMAKKFSLASPAAEQVPKRERQPSVEETPSGQNISCALQEFQTAILACLEDKLEKARKGSLGSLKRPVRFQPSDPQTQRLLQAIDKKLEECMSAKQKIPVDLKRQKTSRSLQSKGELSEDEEREIQVTTPSFHDTPFAGGLVSSSSSLSLFGQEREEPTTSGDDSQLEAWQVPGREEEMALETEGMAGEKKERGKKQEKERAMAAKREPPCRKEKIDRRLPKLEEEEEDDSQRSPPQEEEKQSPGALPEERPSQARAALGEGRKDRTKQPSEELLKQLLRLKEPLWKESKPALEMERLQELDELKERWHLELQEHLQGEKERLQEELRRLEEERQWLEEEEKHVEQWKQMFEQQRVEWEYQQQQHQEQERLWQVQLQHWQQLQQETGEQAQHWLEQREQQKAQQCLLQQEIERLQEQYREYLKMRGEQAEEQWRWSQLKAWHEQQEKIWQEEDEEHARRRCQWQEQLAQHEERLEALQQERQEQEREMERLRQERQERQEALQQVWEKRWQKQLESWHRQLQRHRAQHYKWEEHSKRLQEKQQQHQQRRMEEKAQAAQLKVVEGSALDAFYKQQKASPAAKERRPSTTPQLTPISSTEFEQDALELEATWFPKLFSKVGDLSAPSITEKRYWMNVGAQRKNLELLKEAAQSAVVSSELYMKAKAMINHALHSNAERLALLFQKYKSFYHLQEARKSLTIQLDTAKDIQDGAKMQNLYKMVEKLDAYQRKILYHWMVKQNAVEKKRRRCLEKMIALFAQLRLSTKLHLSDPQPLMIKAEDTAKKEILHMPHIGSVLLKPKVYPSPLSNVKKSPDFTFSAVVREPSNEQLESLWKTDITELSIPLAPKTPVSVLWSEACGFPDIPRLLELDISSIRKKPLQNIKTRIQNIPRWKISGYNFMHL